MLAVATAPDSSVWVGTYGQGIFVLRKGVGSGVWEHIRSSSDTAAHSISWDFVHAFGFGPRGQTWYGTVGNGWGLSTDGGKTWKNWEFRQLGPEWQYVAPDGILIRGDTTYIATADGIKLTWDDGQTWRVITDSIGATTARDSVWGIVKNQYVLSLGATESTLTIAYPSGWATSRDGGRTWTSQPGSSRLEDEYFNAENVRHGRAYTVWPSLCSDPDRFVRAVGYGDVRGTPWGLMRVRRPSGCITVPRAGAQVASALIRGQNSLHIWFWRPIDLADQPYIDQTYRFGSTMGGNFQPHQGVEFNNADGTPVHAIGDGVVVHAGPAEQGALTVAIKHDRRLTTPDTSFFLFSVYYHNSKLLVQIGQRVKTGDVIALVGNTGRATNDHLHLEVHASPFDSTRLVVDPAVRYPPFNRNPELWIEPLRGTGMIAGQVWDSAGTPVYQARIYGLVKAEPRETPFSFIETYGPRNHPDPSYHEHFAVSDVPPGTYVLGTEINGRRVFRQVKVEAGKLTWVEFRPDRR